MISKALIDNEISEKRKAGYFALKPVAYAENFHGGGFGSGSYGGHLCLVLAVCDVTI